MFGWLLAQPQTLFGYLSLLIFTIAAVTIYQIVYHSQWVKKREQDKVQKMSDEVFIANDLKVQREAEERLQRLHAFRNALPTPAEYRERFTPKPAGTFTVHNPMP